MNKSIESNAIIILLYGTSTSGKTTICKHLKNLNDHLKIDSTDTAFKRLEKHSFEKLHKYINDHRCQFPDYRHVQNKFTDAEIYNGILNENVYIKNKEISLMFDLDERDFESLLDETIDQTNILEKKAIITLRRIAKNYFDQVFILVHEEMFNLAINNSMEGIPTILDIVPHPGRSGQFMVDLFVTQLRIKGYVCPTHIALVHCSIPKLAERMLKRNQQAKATNNLEDVRDQSFPFRQYSQLFGVSNTAKSVNLGRLDVVNAKAIIASFCVNLAEAEKIIEEIGLIDDQSGEINVTAKCSYDQMYDSDSQTSAEIAEKIYLIIKQTAT